jgi:predicted RNase H-like nuclease
VINECYPYATIVGADELGYTEERPYYKKLKKGMARNEARQLRAQICDDLIRRVARLATADPAMDLMSQEVTRELVESPSPLDDDSYKKREDLLDAAICVWTAGCWARHGTNRCQVLGLDPDTPERQATIIAPARPQQRAPRARL